MNLRALHTFFLKRSHLLFQAVAHEIEFMRAILTGRVECGFGGRQREDQPAVACIHRLEPENVPEEGAVGFRILAVNNDVSARDHTHLLQTKDTAERLRSERKGEKQISHFARNDNVPCGLYAKLEAGTPAAAAAPTTWC